MMIDQAKQEAGGHARRQSWRLAPNLTKRTNLHWCFKSKTSSTSSTIKVSIANITCWLFILMMLICFLEIDSINRANCINVLNLERHRTIQGKDTNQSLATALESNTTVNNSSSHNNSRMPSNKKKQAQATNNQSPNRRKQQQKVDSHPGNNNGSNKNNNKKIKNNNNNNNNRNSISNNGHQSSLTSSTATISAKSDATSRFRRPSTTTNSMLMADDSEQVGQMNPDGTSIDGINGLQVSITPRVGFIQVPVELDAILKCLISSQTSKQFTKAFKIVWSRYLYDNGVFEQLENSQQTQVAFNSSPNIDPNGMIPVGTPDHQQASLSSAPTNARLISSPLADTVADLAPNADQSGSSVIDNNNWQTQHNSGNSNATSQDGNLLQSSLSSSTSISTKQQQIRADFLARSRQETNTISDLLIEATLSISSIKSSDNGTYYCTAIDGSSNNHKPDNQHQAKIDLLVLAKPSVRLDRIQPARDSKSAQVFWSILSDGNAPIKKTILMVRNDSLTNYAPQAQQFANQDLQRSKSRLQNKVSSSSIILDNDYNQWQRFEITGDGEPHEFGFENVDSSSTTSSSEATASRRLVDEQQAFDENHRVASDVDIVSSSSTFNESFNEASNRANNNNWPSVPSLESGSAGNPINSRRSHLQRRHFNLSSLLPGVSYQVRLAALNDMGLSDWSQMSAIMPNEIPAQISDVFLLSQTTDSLAIGWRRPLYDNAKTIRYEMQLFDLNRTLTWDANTNTTTIVSSSNSTNPSSLGQKQASSPSQRTNFMYYFVNLQPGTDYHFHVRACSRAGCGAYSHPKLLASTLDSEPDEPQDVELACNFEQRNATISWLPPQQIRGKLLNYSVTIDSWAHYRNSSGQWTNDEWRTTMETSDNHTLSLEANNLLQPNTNYSARVCANNRSKQCGKLSSITNRAQCFSPAELPSELPPGIQLSLKPFTPRDQDEISDTTREYVVDSSQLKQQQQLETLALELPTISWRNGSIDCIQIVLIRLPSSYDNTMRALSEYLPDDPAKVKINDLVADQSEPIGSQLATQTELNTLLGQQDHGKSIAYLAEELNQTRANKQLNGQKQQVVILGDGHQQNCRPLWLKISAIATGRNHENNQKQVAPIKSSPYHYPQVRVFDGQLIAQTYYTGFIKLIRVRSTPTTNNQIWDQNSSSMNSQNNNMEGQKLQTRSLREGDNELNYELLTRYSNYFSPIRTGSLVPQVSINHSDDEIQSSLDSTNGSDEKVAVASGDGFCKKDIIGSLESKLSGSIRVCQVFVDFGNLLKQKFVALYKSSSEFLTDGSQFDSLGRLISRSSRPMQLLEIGLIVLLGSLAILFIVYLLTIPTRLRRRRRNKHKQHQQQQSQANSNANDTLHPQDSLGTEVIHLANDASAFHSHNHPHQPQTILNNVNQQQTTDLQTLVSSMGYQQVSAEPTVIAPSGAISYGLVSPKHQHPSAANECPIHSSPAASSITHNHYQQHQELPENCHQYRSNATIGHSNDYQHHNHNHHDHDHNQQHCTNGHHHHHHQQVQQQQLSHEHHNYHNTNQQQPNSFARNCRTMTRQRATSGQSQDLYQVQQQQQLSEAYDARHLTLQQQHNSVLALAKKINKSIPISLFQAVFECRLQNGWLREEFEHLPNGPQRGQEVDSAGKILTAGHTHQFIKLRPQLIVSRDDTISALISGNEQFEGSLIKLKIPLTGASISSQQQHSINQQDDHQSGLERQIICVKSPLDADSVWDFWRLVYEREVSTLVMLTPNEDPQSGELRCAQYWPTCDNEETTILSPCNEYVQSSTIPPAKFKIRQETLSLTGSVNEDGDQHVDAWVQQGSVQVRQLTLMVMATKPSENVDQQLNDGGSEDNNTQQQQATNNMNGGGHEAVNGDDFKQPSIELALDKPITAKSPNEFAGVADNNDDDDEQLLIVERTILHFQFLHWNSASATNRMKLLKFIEFVNEKHLRSLKQQASPGANWHQIISRSPILVHCSNGFGRSGLFAAMSFVLDDLRFKLALINNQNNRQQQQMTTPVVAKVNLFQLIARLRQQRDMILSPYRFYELLYQLTARCIPVQQELAISRPKR